MMAQLFARVVLLAGVLAVTLSGATDATTANSYDAAWSAAWTAHCRALAGAPGRTDGLVLCIGDSVSRFSENAMWPLLGQGQTATDQATIAWCHANDYPQTADGDITCLNGFYLSTWGANQRAYTAAGSLDTAMLLSGTGLPGGAMASTTTSAIALAEEQDVIDDPANLDLTTMLAAFPTAQFAVIELGTNDVNPGRDPVAYGQNLAAIVAAVEAAGILPVLCTCPPRADITNPLIQGYNQQMYQLAQAQGLPLIDFYAEILARRPGTSWQGTLIGSDNVHPSASGNGYDVYSDPYADGGDPTTQTTGAACQWVGFLLRSWLIVQKLGQLHAVLASDPSIGPSGSSSSSSSAIASGPASEGSGSHGCGLGGGVAVLLLGLGWRAWRSRPGIASLRSR